MIHIHVKIKYPHKMQSIVLQCTCPLVPPVSYDETAVAAVPASNCDTDLRNRLQFVDHRRLDFENLASHTITKTTLCAQRMIWICERTKNEFIIITFTLLTFNCKRDKPIDESSYTMEHFGIKSNQKTF